MYTYLMLPAAVRAEVPALAIERRERRGRHTAEIPAPAIERRERRERHAVAPRDTNR